MTAPTVELVYLTTTDLELAPSARDLTGLVVVDHDGLRLGEVDDIVIDVAARRPRLLSVVSGGLLGLQAGETLIPVEAVDEVDGRVRTTWSRAAAHALLLHDLTARSRGSSSTDTPHDDWPTRISHAYSVSGIQPFWELEAGAR